VPFSEDASRKRTANSAQNFSILNKIALKPAQERKTKKQGVKEKRPRAAWGNVYMLKVREATKKWSMPVRNCGIILNQFLTIYEKRVRL